MEPRYYATNWNTLAYRFDDYAKCLAYANGSGLQVCVGAVLRMTKPDLAAKALVLE